MSIYNQHGFFEIVANKADEADGGGKKKGIGDAYMNSGVHSMT